MSESVGRRTLSVRGWFALAAITTFVLIVVVVLAIVLVLGAADDTAQDRLDRSATVLRDGADHWDDAEWVDATARRLASDDVSFVLFGGDDDAARGSTPDTGSDGDEVVRTIRIEGTDPPRSAQLSTPVDDEDPLAGILRGTLVIGAVAAAVSFAFGRPFIRPLRAVRQAARRVTEGDLVVDLPRTRITEVDDVMTAFDHMTTELDRSLAQQAELERERRLFIAAVAHDLRTPLFSLRGYLEGLETGVAGTAEQRARYVAIAGEKARTLERLVDDLFDFSRLEYLDQSLELDPLDLAELLGDVVDGLAPQAAAKDVSLQLWPHGHSLPVDGDRAQLVRAVTNLLDNALRYTPSGGSVDVTCGSNAEGVWFTVADTGPGIDPSDLPHLFHPLYRGGTGTADAGNGAGLGLAIAQRVLTAHGGTIAAANGVDGGAVFAATLPPGSSTQ